MLAATKQFVKDVGAPDPILCDMARKQLSSETKQLCNAMGMMLRALEEDTPWANEAKLYIKLMKEADRKTMREADPPLAFWDYCFERRVWIYNLLAQDHIKMRGTTTHTATTGKEGIYPTSANTSGLTGATTESMQQNFHTSQKSLCVCVESCKRKGK